MAPVIAVASGKGGTGKTTVAVNLALAFGREVALADCDVEEPNAHLFLGNPGNGGQGGVRPKESIDEEVFEETETVSLPIPKVDESRCDGCGECSRFCQYKAIVSFGSTALVFPEMCHGCGGCAQICPRQAIVEVDHRIGVIGTKRVGPVTLVQGRMDIGMTMAPPMIRAVKRRVERSNDRNPIIIDAPPGAACPAMAALRGADGAVLVTEPTPFGLHDLRLAIEAIREMALPFGVVVNRVGVGDHRVHSHCLREGIPIFAEIPDDRRIAEAYSRGERIIQALPEYRGLFVDLAARVMRSFGGRGGK